MTYRTATVHTAYQQLTVGPFAVKQPLPSPAVDQVSPFLLLHHAGPSVHQPGELKSRLSPHPHRGFEPVTFLFSGKIHHKDSTGSEGFLESGDVQWMTAGSGILHSEGPSAEFARQGGIMELVQLWVNLPRQYKMTPPKYQDIKKNQLPEAQQDGFAFRVVAGTFLQVQGPAATFTPIIAATATVEAGAATSVHIPAHYNALVYVLEGKLSSNGAVIDAFQMAVFDHRSDHVALKAETAGRFLLLAGAPINEPVARYGPFVMNYMGEIKQAILDYETGKMGVLES